MPFIGQDWRSPGEAWVKTESLGWQRMKLIESQLHPGCSQNPACSWPPRTEFGQHMATNCNLHDHELREINSSPGSSDSGRGNSVSPSPSCSPEKSNRHLFPLAISSPYGRYSCCPHQFDANGQQSKFCDIHLTGAGKHTDPNSSCDSSNVRVGYDDYERTTPNIFISSNNQPSINVLNKIDKETNSLSERNTNIELSKSIREPSSNKSNCQSSQVNSSPSIKETIHNIDDKQTESHRSNSCCSCHQGSSNLPNNVEPQARTAPYCPISVRTREVAIYNTISEALYRLDFCNAVHDIRRFNYICKLLHLLITQSLTSLSGCATKVLFTILEQIACEVSNNKRNIHVLKNLLRELKETIQKYYCWGRPIGSSQLWQQHFDTIERISQMVDGIELTPPKSENGKNGVTFSELPVEMVREILLRLNDHRDLVNAARASPIMQSMINSQYIWRRLCKYHFTEHQVKMVLEDYKISLNRKNLSNGTKYARLESGEAKISNIKFTDKSKAINKLDSQRTSENQKVKESDNKSSLSYVTKTIKIFDKEGSSATLGSGEFPASKPDMDKRARHVKVGQHNNRPNQRSNRAPNERQSKAAKPSHEIDWEQVFHQLRKRFDLKEEYADCLLLCRHCRCLFWKSFGHPCVRDDGSNAQTRCSCPDVNRPRTIPMADVSAYQVRQSSLDSQLRGNHEDRDLGLREHRRLSVAALSRNFDNRAQNQHDAIRPYGLNLAQNRAEGRSQNGPLREIQNDRFRNVNRGRGRANEANRNNENQSQRAVRNRNDLVPKHVAISPQAFLKFFSL